MYHLNLLVTGDLHHVSRDYSAPRRGDCPALQSANGGCIQEGSDDGGNHELMCVRVRAIKERVEERAKIEMKERGLSVNVVCNVKDCAAKCVENDVGLQPISSCSLELRSSWESSNLWKLLWVSIYILKEMASSE